jgi:DNA-binding CsgD family transcriptional regulator
MLELCTPPLDTTPASAFHALGLALRYQGPERRGGAGLLTRLMTQLLDEIDYGLLLMGEGRQVLHANHAARASLAAQHPLQLVGNELRPRLAKDLNPLQQALLAAAQRGLRRLLAVGDAQQRASVAVVPLAGVPGVDALTDGGLDAPATLVVLGRREVAGGLSVQGFARAHGLSPNEARVLAALCEGCCPNHIAERHGVKIATVRTQIANIRAKTGAESIRDLVQQVAVLPPLVGVLRAAA